MKVKGRDSANEIVEAQEVTDDRMETHKTQNVTDKITEIKETE